MGGQTDDRPTAPDGPPGPVRRHRARRLVVPVLLVACLVAGAVVGITTRGRVDATRASLTTTRDELAAARRHLAVAVGDLADELERSGRATARLTADTGTLGALETTLASLRGRVDRQGVDITAETACLTAVEQALNQIALGDSAGGAATLDRAAGTCQAAEPGG